MEIKKSQLKSKVRNFFTQKVRNIKENKRQQYIIETEGKILYSAIVLDEESRNKLLDLMRLRREAGRRQCDRKKSIVGIAVFNET